MTADRWKSSIQKELVKTGFLLMMEHGILWSHTIWLKRHGRLMSRVGVAASNEVHILGEAFVEVHRKTSPEGVGHVPRLQQAHRMEVFGLVVLAAGAPLHKVRTHLLACRQ